MKSKVIFTNEITSENLLKIYHKLGRNLSGNVAVKVHSGEPGGHNFLKPEFMKQLVDEVKGTIVECNTAYEGRRNTTEEHFKAIEEHGFNQIAKVDIMDAEGELSLPIEGGKHLHANYVGSHFEQYDSLLILSHFKGHGMGGFGGALKNTSIGLASSYGKAYIHGAGDPEKIWTANQNDFLESMAEAAGTILEARKDKIVFINVMCNLSIDCDCSANPQEPEMKDIGILASLDPVALDQACVDLIYQSDDPGKDSLIKRMEEKNGIHILEEASLLKLGNREYELINLETL